MCGEHGFHVSIVDELPPEQQMALYAAEGWCDSGENPERLRAIIAGSFLVAAARSGTGELIGMGRMISDGAGDAYIQDVVVRADYRGHGVGAAVVSALASEAARRKIAWIGLVAAPGTAGFYEKLGFRRMKDHVPMLLDASGGLQDD